MKRSILYGGITLDMMALAVYFNTASVGTGCSETLWICWSARNYHTTRIFGPNINTFQTLI